MTWPDATIRRRIARALCAGLAVAALAISPACSGASTTQGRTAKSPSAGASTAARAVSRTPSTAAGTSHACAPPYPAGAVTALTVFCADPSHMEVARVLRIVDGDTMHVELDGKEEIVRFYGIDTTERGQACFEEGTERTTELAGSEVRLLRDARERDKYGRLLRYVYTPEGLSIDAEMVDEGMAHAWRSDGALRFAIIGLEDGARERHAGCLWR